MAQRGTVLVVSGDSPLRAACRTALEPLELGVADVAGWDEAQAELARAPFDVLVLPVQLVTPALGLVNQRYPDVSVITLATVEERAQAIEALREGARDFVELPLDAEGLGRAVLAVVEAIEADGEHAPPTPGGLAKLVGESPTMTKLRTLIQKAASGKATVLVRGETGTGKELVARAVHAQSDRAAGPFIKVHCGAVPENLLESELFGYERGAFTGATARKPGRVELAEGGSLFLDEIGDISATIQVKLLRLLQDREYERLGGTQTLRADVRFITATHRDLEGMVRSGEFREDLFYRLNVVPIWVPPLRTRRDDIAVLVQRFVAGFAEANGKDGLRIEDDAIALIEQQRWPGNVRQLENFIERLVVLSEGSSLTASDIKSELSVSQVIETQRSTVGSMITSSRCPPSAPLVPLSEAVRAAERAALEKALRHTRGNRTLAARLLGVSRATLYNKLAEYGVG